MAQTSYPEQSECDARKVLLQRISEDRFGFALSEASEELKGDREIVLAAVSKHGRAIQYASQELKGDREIVMTAISNRGWFLMFAPQELKGDQEVMQRALERSSRELVGLRVSLLSGRCCHEVFRFWDSREYVLRCCARSLNLDGNHVERHGTLMCGHVEVNALSELQLGKLHEITLVLP